MYFIERSLTATLPRRARNRKLFPDDSGTQVVEAIEGRLLVPAKMRR